MSVATPPAVESAMPPRAVLRVMNPTIRGVLRSPLHRLLSKKLMVLTVSGRKTGRLYSTPVGRHETDDGLLLVSASGSWRHNLRGGAPVVVTIDGLERAAHAELEENPDRVAAIFKTLLDQLGPDNAKDLGLKLNIGRQPTAAEIRPAVASRGIARIRLDDAVDDSVEPAEWGTRTDRGIPGRRRRARLDREYTLWTS